MAADRAGSFVQLLEMEGKQLFARHGIRVPRGALWPDVPTGTSALVVKAQLPTGGRGKRGGVRFAADPIEAAGFAHALLGTVIGAHRVERVYVEERVAIERELYLAVALDRDQRCYAILASAGGGVDVESVPEHRLLRLPIDPIGGPTGAELRHLAEFLELPDERRREAEQLTSKLYALVLEEDAELAEINPLALTASGLIACDAKVVLDTNAAFRHTDRRQSLGPGNGTEVERAIAAAGSTGIEISPQGEITGVVSGAGLMMATLDMLVDRGARVRLMVDLGGVVLAGPQRIAPVLRAIAAVRPRTTFVNAYFQTARCDDFASALAGAWADAPLTGRVVIRLKGRFDARAREILAPLGFDVHADLQPALAAALAAS